MYSIIGKACEQADDLFFESHDFYVMTAFAGCPEKDNVLLLPDERSEG
ncbi:hypothetical protein [Paenibacillus oryzisoli]|nr:hypothetical protein [Paenibacillus oryzisoli]